MDLSNTHFIRVIQLLSVLYIRLPQKIPFEKENYSNAKNRKLLIAYLISVLQALMFYMSMKKES